MRRIVLYYVVALLLIVAVFALVGWIGSPDIARPGASNRSNRKAADRVFLTSPFQG